MNETELEKAEKRLAQAQARVQALKARAATAERKKDTRRKIILGGALLEKARKGDDTARRLIAEIITGLERPVDRSAFDKWDEVKNDAQNR